MLLSTVPNVSQLLNFMEVGVFTKPQDFTSLRNLSKLVFTFYLDFCNRIYLFKPPCYGIYYCGDTDTLIWSNRYG